MKIPESSYTSSKHHKKLLFDSDPPGNTVYFDHSFQDYDLEARILYNSDGAIPWIFSVHGARGDFSKADAVAFGLQKRGYSLLSMNMSGHSKAGVLHPEQTTLGDNVGERWMHFINILMINAKVVIAYS